MLRDPVQGRVFIGGRDRLGIGIHRATGLSPKQQGGDPQDLALEAIDSTEPGDRGLYAGPVGWVDAAGNGEFAVGLRSSHVGGNTASIWAGVGVVGDSDPEAELAETRAKFQAMLGALLRP